MKTIVNILAILLIIFGIATLGYNTYTYLQQQKIVPIGNVEVRAQVEKTFTISPMVGGLSLIVGIVLIMIGRLGKKH